MKITYLMQSERKKIFSCIQIMFALFLFVSLANAQNQKVQLSGANQTLKTAFKQIEQQTKMSVDYDAEVINTSRQVPTITKTLTVNELLKQLLRNTGYTYTFEGSHILIKVQQLEGKKKKVTGTITDETGLSVIGANVESALMTHPAVVECAITGVPDEIRGQVVKATIVLSKEYKNRAGEELIKELQNHVKKVTAPYKYPRVIEFVEELPKTISGKIRRVEIRENDQK